MRTAVTCAAAVGLMSWCIASFVGVGASAASLEAIEFESASQPPVPGDRIRGLLAKPDGAGPYPAVVVLHGCAGMHETTQRKLADDLVGWGHVALLVDSFATRGIDQACTNSAGMGSSSLLLKRMSDAYGALAFLARQPLVDIRRVAAVGFSQGAWVTLLVAQPRSFEWFTLPGDMRFRAAVAFYPLCRRAGLRPGIPTLILIGAVDDWTPPEDCSLKLVSWGTDGPPIEQVVYPGTHHGFYYPHLQPGAALFGHWVEYNSDAAHDASARMRQFLDRHLN